MNKNETAALLAAFAQLPRKDRIFVMAIAQSLKDRLPSRGKGLGSAMPPQGGAR